MLIPTKIAWLGEAFKLHPDILKLEWEILAGQGLQFMWTLGEKLEWRSKSLTLELAPITCKDIEREANRCNDTGTFP